MNLRYNGNQDSEQSLDLWLPATGVTGGLDPFWVIFVHGVCRLFMVMGVRFDD